MCSEHRQDVTATLPEILIPGVTARITPHVKHQTIGACLRVVWEDGALEPVHEQRLVVVGFIERGRGIAVSKGPSSQGRGINKRFAPVMDGGVVCEEGVADEFRLFLGDDDRVCDVEEGRQACRCVRGLGGGPAGSEIHGAHVGGEEGLQLVEKVEQDGVGLGCGCVGRELVGKDPGWVGCEGGEAVVEDVLRDPPEDRVAGQEAGCVELGSERHDTTEADEAVGGSVAEEPLDFRGAADAASCVGADGEVEPRIRTNAGTGSRGGRRRVLVPVASRIEGGMVVHPVCGCHFSIGELTRLLFANHNGSGVDQLLHD